MTSTPVNRRPVFLLLFLFIAPLAFAFWLYYGSSWRPTLRTNHGTLIEPMVTLPIVLPRQGDPLFKGKWSLLVLGGGDAGCDAGCRNALVYARQTWLSLGKLIPRVQRVLLAGSACCDASYLEREHRGLVTVDATTGSAAFRAVPTPHRDAVFVVDPLGNLMMRYDVQQDPKGLREDLKKLLELSHIG